MEENRIVSGRYRVESLIGTGGMANVYKAYDMQTHRIVALKVLKAEHRADAEFVRRFEREAKAVLTLSHENIVRSYNVGEDGEWSYIVLEYVEGETLKDLIRDGGSLPPRQAVNILCQILDALSHAHEMGIIHRDVKPQNVIITSRGKAMLTDFGIARDASSTTRTFAGTSVIGSVHYISPEQARGDNVTAGSDIYSCAIMLYEMVTGEVPFEGDNSVSIALKHLQEEITPPIEVNPKISNALNDVIMKGASKSMSRRYLTARQMKNDLLRALREPNGRFARTQGGSESKNQKRYSGVANITIMVVVALGLFFALFLIARTFNDHYGSQTTELQVPPLVGKSVEDAQSAATLRGFGMEITEYVSSEEFAEGIVISQTPITGTRGKQGDIIEVVVSEGSSSALILVPNLLNKTEQEAQIEATSVELKLVIAEYVASDKPAGTVVRQLPDPGRETYPGDTIEIWVSGTPGQRVEVPLLTGRKLDAALEMLHNLGMERIWLRYKQPEKIAEENEVLRQSPSANMTVSSSTLVELDICSAGTGPYVADIAKNVDVKDEATSIVITALREDGVEVVLYESTLATGMQSVSFTANLNFGGDVTCIFYVGGVETDRKTVNFVVK